MPDTVKGLKAGNKALRSEIEVLKEQLNEVCQRISTPQTPKKAAIDDQPYVMSSDHIKAVEFISNQYDDLDVFRKQAAQDIKEIRTRLEKVSRSCDELCEAIEAMELHRYQYNIKIVGVPSVNDNESADKTAAICVKLFSALGVNNVSLQAIHTDNRVQKRNQHSSGSPNQIICKFVRRLAKDKVMAARKKLYDQGPNRSVLIHKRWNNTDELTSTNI